ncbi:hypothetical protein [Phaeodactylibacter sp.]|uniref:hypothetical protein n=1 Tax=Phaeodactylibacter sp. TaxID=1940289 RepID=UPI0025EDD7A7|nr:hypothetical protein [Phaeodactylibacter sp.]
MNTHFKKLRTTKKGRIGELIVKKLFDKWGWQYKEAPNRAHGIDFRVITHRGERIGVDAKTYPRRACCQDNGIDYADFRKYLRFNGRVLLIFIDQYEGMIYGQYLDELKQRLRVKDKVYFRLSDMTVVRPLTEKEQKRLSKYKLPDFYAEADSFFNPVKPVLPRKKSKENELLRTLFENPDTQRLSCCS